MRKANKKTIGLTFLLLMGGFGPRYSPCAAPAPHDVHVSISDGPDGSHLLEGRFSVEKSSDTVWAVLSDYDRLSTFVSSIRSSRKVQGNSRLVEQTMTGRAGFFRKKVHLLLELEEEPGRKISFRDISNRSFKLYEGTCEIANDGNKTHVHYKLKATPDFFSPDFIAVKAFKRNVSLLLTEVRNEIMGREHE